MAIPLGGRYVVLVCLCVRTMLTTLVPTTVVRTAMTTTMSFDAFHSVATLARFHGQNFTSAWLKAC